MNLRGGFRKIVQRYAPTRLKRRLWDREFAHGRWDLLQQLGTDPIYPYLEKYARGGSILDLGCGPGTTANELSPVVYESYTGVDISTVALAIAQDRSKLSAQTSRHEYVRADLSTYKPTRLYDVIVAGDSLYYLRPGQVVPTLRRYARYLRPSGVLLIKLNGMPKHEPLVQRLERSLDVVERAFCEPDVKVLACRAMPREHSTTLVAAIGQLTKTIDKMRQRALQNARPLIWLGARDRER